MDIARRSLDASKANEYVKFCLDQLEALSIDNELPSWNIIANQTLITVVTVEEMVGALVAAEVALEQTEEAVDQYNES